MGIGDSEAVTETGFDLFARPPGWQDAAHRVSAIAIGEKYRHSVREVTYTRRSTIVVLEGFVAMSVHRTPPSGSEACQATKLQEELDEISLEMFGVRARFGELPVLCGGDFNAEIQGHTTASHASPPRGPSGNLRQERCYSIIQFLQSLTLSVCHGAAPLAPTYVGWGRTTSRSRTSGRGVNEQRRVYDHFAASTRCTVTSLVTREDLQALRKSDHHAVYAELHLQASDINSRKRSRNFRAQQGTTEKTIRFRRDWRPVGEGAVEIFQENVDRTADELEAKVHRPSTSLN